MNRTLFVTIHMYLSAFFAPFVLLVSISGGLYLLGVKGSVQEQSVYLSADNAINSQSETLKADVDALLLVAGVSNYDYEYVKVKGSTLYTRPTSRQHYVIELGDEVEVMQAQPSLQNALVELHKGHGPTAFKTFQKFFALGLILIIVSGLWLGISARRLRARTLLTSLAGFAAFAVFALL